jgi:hypothetical protein
VTFQFNIQAPQLPGDHRFQWRMVQEMVEWFGDYTPDTSIGISPPPQSTTVPDVREMSSGTAANEIRTAGLVPSFTGPSGPHSWVASQSPPAGQMVNRGTTVTCYLKDGLIP